MNKYYLLGIKCAQVVNEYKPRATVPLKNLGIHNYSLNAPLQIKPPIMTSYGKEVGKIYGKNLPNILSRSQLNANAYPETTNGSFFSFPKWKYTQKDLNQPLAYTSINNPFLGGGTGGAPFENQIIKDLRKFKLPVDKTLGRLEPIHFMSPGGVYSMLSNANLSPSQDRKTIKSTLLHELSHAKSMHDDMENMSLEFVNRLPETYKSFTGKNTQDLINPYRSMAGYQVAPTEIDTILTRANQEYFKRFNKVPQNIYEAQEAMSLLRNLSEEASGYTERYDGMQNLDILDRLDAMDKLHVAAKKDSLGHDDIRNLILKRLLQVF